MPLATLTEIKSRIGKEVGMSGWIAVDQARIDAFADATEDRAVTPRREVEEAKLRLAVEALQRHFAAVPGLAAA